MVFPIILFKVPIMAPSFPLAGFGAKVKILRHMIDIAKPNKKTESLNARSLSKSILSP